MLNRFVLVVILVPLAIVVVALAVANRQFAAFTFDPFNPGNPALTVQLPLFVLLFLVFTFGLLTGSAASWWKQRRYRRLARQREQELDGLRASTQQPGRMSMPALPPARSATG